jgi:hypothetical protein
MKRATPSRWAHLWTRFLANLNWQPPLASATLLGWQAGLDDLARLTAILGELPIDAALQEFERILERPAPAALPLRGVHVLGHIDDVGPGYDAVWVTASPIPSGPRHRKAIRCCRERYSDSTACRDRRPRRRARLRRGVSTGSCTAFRSWS